MNQDENLKIGSGKVVRFLFGTLLLRTLVLMGTFDAQDDEFGFDLLDSRKPKCMLNSERWFYMYTYRIREEGGSGRPRPCPRPRPRSFENR